MKDRVVKVPKKIYDRIVSMPPSTDRVMMDDLLLSHIREFVPKTEPSKPKTKVTLMSDDYDVCRPYCQCYKCDLIEEDPFGIIADIKMRDKTKMMRMIPFDSDDDCAPWCNCMKCLDALDLDDDFLCDGQDDYEWTTEVEQQ